MTLSVGDRLPDVELQRRGADGRPEAVSLREMTAGRKVVIFGLPGAYTGTCSTAHVPSFMRTRAQFADRGVDAVICVSVNDAFVMGAWGDHTGAGAAGIEMMGDPGADFTRAIGMNFSAPPVGFFDRSRRYAMLVEDGEVKILNVEDNVGRCEVSAGETLLGQM